ncbi:MAG: hypothetical protein KF763_08210 [Cyclobacteriaceae bacterium]|nr:hypothetical protein [Cyclobacteriaceae bacterium]
MRKIVGVGVVMVIAFSVGFIQLTGCNADFEPDPCLNKKITGGSFSIGELISNYGIKDTLLLSDTVITDNFVVFRADSNYTSYEWKIGDDPRTFTTKEVSLLFRYPESNLPIRLIAKWLPDKRCFPEDDGIDTVYRYLTVIDKELNPIFGSYEGALTSNPTDIYTVEIVPDFYSSAFYMININKGCEATNLNVRMRFGYKAVALSQLEGNQFYAGSCKNPKGWIILNRAGTELTATYTVGNGTEFQVETKRSKEQFIGKKM